MKTKLTIALAVTGLLATSAVSAYETDGYLNDWLTNNGSWTALSGVGLYTEQDGLSGSYGGQDYDTELLVADVDWDTNTLHVAVVSGVDPDQGGTGGFTGSPYPPGDLAIYTGSQYNQPNLWNVNADVIDWDGPSYIDPNDVYGVLITDYLDTASGTTADTGNTSVSTEVYQGALWYTANHPETGEKHITSIQSTTDTSPSWSGTEPIYNTGTADIAHTTADWKNTDGTTSTFMGGGHYIIEAAIPLASLGYTGGDTFNVALHWTMNCANDYIAGSGSWTKRPTPPGSVPEPGPLAIMALGLLGIGVTRKYAAKQKS